MAVSAIDNPGGPRCLVELRDYEEVFAMAWFNQRLVFSASLSSCGSAFGLPSAVLRSGTEVGRGEAPGLVVVSIEQRDSRGECKRRKAIIRVSETRTNLRCHQGLVQEKLRTPVYRNEPPCYGRKPQRVEV